MPTVSSKTRSDAGRQAYVICPMVEAERDARGGERHRLYRRACAATLSPSIRVEYLHGKMKGKEKNAIMEAFAANEIHVLVSTTVIEVGINVPNATVMMIRRMPSVSVWRSSISSAGASVEEKTSPTASWSTPPAKKDAGKRLDILNKSNDGFYIASEDLKLARSRRPLRRPPER